jgi:hypothetical protein
MIAETGALWIKDVPYQPQEFQRRRDLGGLAAGAAGAARVKATPCDSRGEGGYSESRRDDNAAAFNGMLDEFVSASNL